MSIVAMFLATAVMIGPARATQAKVQLVGLPTSTINPGDTFSVDVTVVDVVGLNAMEFKLSYDPFVLKATGVQKGPFLSTAGPTLFLYVISVFGDYVQAGDALFTPTWVDGSGVLATITFKAIGAGSSALHFDYSTLVDVNLAPIDHATFDGSVVVHAVAEVTGRWEEKQRFVMSTELDVFNTMYAKVTNHGTVSVTAYVQFMFFDMTGVMKTQNSATVAIAPGADAVLSSDFDTSLRGVGTYDVTARAYFSYDAINYFRGEKGKILSFVVLP